MKVLTAREAAGVIADGAIVTVSASSGLGCPDAVLEAIGAHFAETGHPRDLTTLHPIAAGDMYSIKGIDHIARPGLLARTICGSYPSGPSSAEPPAIYRMIEENTVAAYNVPSGILFDMHREAAAKRPGVLTKVGLDTFVDPDREGCAMTPAAAAQSIVRHERLAGEDWLFFPSIAPDVAIIRATTADEQGNLTYEHEGAFLGALDQALAARNAGGTVIAQVKRLARSGTLRPQDVRVPGILVDFVVVAPDQLQTTQTAYDPAISGEISRPLDSFEALEHSLQKVIARRVAMELARGMTVNLGFGISSNVPRILLEEGQHGAVTWVIEQGAVGGVPLTGFAFGCASNAEAIMPSPHQFTYFQAGAFDAALLSFLEIKRLHQSLETTIVYVTHDQIEAMTLATRIAVLNDGVLQQFGTPADIYDDPVNLFVADFMGSPPMNLFPVTVEADSGGPSLRIERAGGEPATLPAGRAEGLAARAGGEAILGIRPEAITEVSADGAANAEAVVGCLIEVVEPAGADTYVVTHLGGKEVVARTSPDAGIRAGETVPLAFRLDKAVFFDPDTHAHIT